MLLADLEFFADLELAEKFSGGQAPPAVFQGGTTGLTTVANFNPDRTATQTDNSSFSNLTGSFPAFDVTYGSNASTIAVPVG